MKEPDGFPRAVIENLERYNRQHPEAKVTIKDVQWDSMNGCWFFSRYNMYHGIEIDGHIHT